MSPTGYDPDVGDEALFVWSDVTEESLYPGGRRQASAVTSLPNGGYVITWQVFDATSSTNHAKAQIFAADGTATSAVIDVGRWRHRRLGATPATSWWPPPAFANGDFLVIWQGVNNGNHELYGQRYDGGRPRRRWREPDQ
ncbi:MAG: hypothetical protein WDN06_15320 [Asticcacaulis sp.]